MKNYTVLIVDDDEKFRQSQKRLLNLVKLDDAEVSFLTLESDCGNEAMKIIQEKHIDCVLLDYQMPGGDGLEWLDKFLTVKSDLAVIIVTGGGSEHVAVEAMKHGAMDYIVKGHISLEGLQRAVVNVVEKIEMRKLLKEQQETLLEAERQRVMIESLGAACHHLGQPATVITLYLELMKDKEKDPELREMIDACLKAANETRKIMERLEGVSQYRTVPYLPNQEACEDRIIEI